MSAPEDRSDAVPLAHTEGYFEAQYATDPDPWGFETAWYERRKYALTMAAFVPYSCQVVGSRSTASLPVVI